MPRVIETKFEVIINRKMKSRKVTDDTKVIFQLVIAVEVT